MKQDENEKNHTKVPTPVTGQKPNGKSRFERTARNQAKIMITGCSLSRLWLAGAARAELKTDLELVPPRSN